MPRSNIWNTRVRVTDPAATKPITLQELKDWLRITNAVEDAALNLIIDITTDMVQQYLGRYLITTKMRMQMDRNRIDGNIGFFTLSDLFASIQEIELPWLPLLVVDEVSTFTVDNVQQIFDPANYNVDNNDLDLWGRVILDDTAVWPVDLRPAQSLQVIYDVGYGPDATDYPVAIKGGLLQLAGYLYKNRGDCSGNCNDVCESAGITGLLSIYRVRKI